MLINICCTKNRYIYLSLNDLDTKNIMLGPWYLMVTKSMLRTHDGKQVFSEKKTTVLDQVKCLKHFKYQRLRITCAPISELPSNMFSANNNMQ